MIEYPTYPEFKMAEAIVEGTMELVTNQLAHVYCRMGQMLNDDDLRRCQQAICDAQDMLQFLLGETKYERIYDSKHKEVINFE